MGAMVHGLPPAKKTAVHIFRLNTYRTSKSDIETLLKQRNDWLGVVDEVLYGIW